MVFPTFPGRKLFLHLFCFEHWKPQTKLFNFTNSSFRYSLILFPIHFHYLLHISHNCWRLIGVCHECHYWILEWLHHLMYAYTLLLLYLIHFTLPHLARNPRAHIFELHLPQTVLKETLFITDDLFRSYPQIVTIFFSLLIRSSFSIFLLFHSAILDNFFLISHLTNQVIIELQIITLQTTKYDFWSSFIYSIYLH